MERTAAKVIAPNLAKYKPRTKFGNAAYDQLDGCGHEPFCHACQEKIEFIELVTDLAEFASKHSSELKARIAAFLREGC